jgi:putative transposase
MKVLIRPNWAGDFTMKRTRHTAEQIIRKLKSAEQLIDQGKTVVAGCPTHLRLEIHGRDCGEL